VQTWAAAGQTLQNPTTTAFALSHERDLLRAEQREVGVRCPLGRLQPAAAAYGGFSENAEPGSVRYQNLFYRTDGAARDDVQALEELDVLGRAAVAGGFPPCLTAGPAVPAERVIVPGP
jgi:hypothetical protein